MMTAACGASAFRDKTTTLMTRVFLNYEDSGRAIGNLLYYEFHWKVVAMMTEYSTEDSSPRNRECYFTNMGVGYVFKAEFHSKPHSIRLKPHDDDYIVKLLEVKMYARGKSTTLSP